MLLLHPGSVGHRPRRVEQSRVSPDLVGGMKVPFFGSGQGPFLDVQHRGDVDDVDDYEMAPELVEIREKGEVVEGGEGEDCREDDDGEEVDAIGLRDIQRDAGDDAGQDERADWNQGRKVCGDGRQHGDCCCSSCFKLSASGSPPAR